MTQERYQGGYQMTSIGKYKIKDIQKKKELVKNYIRKTKK